ncbi:MAG: drug/metabolite-transporting permease [Bacteroidetes bacterium]|nr:drug/metabolite-transporting permease [Bacteroidota bacterium]
MIGENLYTQLIRGAQFIKQKLDLFNPFYYYKQGTKGKAILALVAVCMFWGLTWVISKVGVKHMPALQLAGIRQFVAGVIYVSFFLLRGEQLPKGKQWRPILILSFLNFMMSNGLSTWGIKYISAGMGAIMGAIFPLWLVIIGLFASKEKLPRKAIVGLLIGFSGVCTIFSEHLQDFLNPDFRFGIGLSLIATWTWAFATLYTKQQALSFNPYFSLGLQMVIAGSTLFGVSHLIGQSVPLTDIPLKAWGAIACLIIFGSLIAFICYLYALQNLPTEQASIYAYVNPIVAAFVGWLYLNDTISLTLVLGALITLFYVYLVNQAFRINPAEQPEPEGV